MEFQKGLKEQDGKLKTYNKAMSTIDGIYFRSKQEGKNKSDYLSNREKIQDAQNKAKGKIKDINFKVKINDKNIETLDFYS